MSPSIHPLGFGLLAMRLLNQTVAVICAVILVSFGTALLVRSLAVMPLLIELEARSDRKDLRRVLLALEGRQLQLSALSYANATRDAAYHFMERRDAEFLAGNFAPETFYSLDLDTVALFDRSGELVAQRSIDPQQIVFMERPLPLAELQPVLPDLRHAHGGAPVFDSGVLRSGVDVFLYAVTSITCTTDDTCGANGYLLLLRQLDADLFAEISETTQLHVTATPAAPTARPQPIEQLYRDDGNRLGWLLSDHRGEPALQLSLQLAPREFGSRLLSIPLLVAFVTSILSYICLLWLVRRLLIQPIQRFGRVLQQVRLQGDLGLRIDTPLSNELGDLGRHIDEVLRHAESQRAQLQDQARRMQTLSYLDGLTGLANRRRFDQSLADNWALAQRTRKPLALIMLDVDYFKPFNDNYGHQRGDEVLKQVAAVIRGAVVRQSDLATRYGGEEFALLLPNTGEEGAAQLAERLRLAIREAAIPHEYSHIGRHLTCSFGVAALVPDPHQSPRDLVRRADEALYASKAGGRNCVTRATALG
jgi:diguanylate cyclase (GGDEF)-like protein